MKQTKYNRWKHVAISFIIVTIIMTAFTGILFMKSGYAQRIAIKIGWGIYNPSGRESNVINGWNSALDDFSSEIVFLGDSIVYGGEWDTYFPEKSVCKLAVPGDSIEQVLYRADMVKKLDPSKVFILVGVNNVSRGNYEKTIEDNYSQLLDVLSDIECEIYVQSILPVRKPSKVDNNRINTANEIIHRLADKYNCTYIDIHTSFLNEDGEMKQELTKDGVHLNEDGYKVWIEQIRDFVF